MRRLGRTNLSLLAALVALLLGAGGTTYWFAAAREHRAVAEDLGRRLLDAQEEASQERARAQKRTAELDVATQEEARLAGQLSRQQQRSSRLDAELESAREEAAAQAERATAAEQQAAAAGQRAGFEQRRAAMADDLLSHAVMALAREQERGRQPTARELLDKVAGRLKRQPPKPVAASLYHTIGWSYHMLHAYDGAEEHLRRAVDLRREALGEEHPKTIRSALNLASALMFQGKVEEAVEVQRQVVESSRRHFGGEHESTATALDFLAAYLAYLGRLEQATKVMRELLGVNRSRYAHRPVHVYWTIRRLAELLQAQGELPEAEALLREALANAVEHHGEDDRRTFDTRCRLAWVLRLGGKAAEAESVDRLVTELAAFMEEIGEPYATDSYGRYLLDLGELEKAEAYLLTSYRKNKGYGYRGPQLFEFLQPLVDLYTVWKKPEKAARYRAMMVTLH